MFSGTAEWAGKNTSYEPNETREYQLLVDWVNITPMTPENSTDPWPGSKYLKQMETGGNDGANGGTNGGSGSGGGANTGNGGSGGTGGTKNMGTTLSTHVAGTFVIATAAVVAGLLVA